MLTAELIAREIDEGFGDDSRVPDVGPTPEWITKNPAGPEAYSGGKLALPQERPGDKLALPGERPGDTMERASFAPVEFEPQAAVLDYPPRALHSSMLTPEWAWRWFPMGGWVYHSVTARMQREDQGQDFEVPLGHHVIAPSWGKCVHHLCDRPFPNGFGCPYAVVWIGGPCRFQHRFMYLGHDNAEVIPAGEWFHSEAILARPNNSLNHGWGWTELGHAPNGFPGPFGEGARFHWAFAPVRKWSRF